MPRAKPTGTLLYAQSGGVTAVINATAAAVIREAQARGIRVLAARNGILGVLHEQLQDVSKLPAASVDAIANTPGGAFGSCRFKLGSPKDHPGRFERLLAVLAAHDVRYFLYNGGNDSADTSWRVSQLAAASGFPLTCIGVPKTIDNDLALTDCCPGFGSAAKYTAVSIREVGLDLRAMASSSTKVFVHEVMGRHAGWLAAAAGLAGQSADDAPQIILFPERAFDQDRFLAEVDRVVRRVGWCVVVASEGLRDAAGQFVAEAGLGKDAFGHAQLGGVAPFLAGRVVSELKLKVHWALPDYLQRSARHLASQTDWDQAQAVGRAAVGYALEGRNAVMPAIVRTSDRPYRWKIEPVPLARVANREKVLPGSFLRRDGFGITSKARTYLEPLIRGEAPLPYGRDGLPKYLTLPTVTVRKRLGKWAG